MKKYYITVHILFWILIVTLLFGVLSFLFLKDYNFASLFPFIKSAEFPEEEKVVVTKIKEVKKEVDWYYFIATGYSANDPAQGTNDTTVTGEDVKEGIIAVDPDVIPLGTKVEIKEMGVFTAEDTGGKIKGNRIDIYFDSKKEAEDFGKKGIWIRLISNNSRIELADLYGNVPLYSGTPHYGNLSTYE